MQFGAYTFVETRRDPTTGEPVDVDQAFAYAIEQIELADRVGLDVFGLGEHHPPDYAVSAPAVALAAEMILVVRPEIAGPQTLEAAVGLLEPSEHDPERDRVARVEVDRLVAALSPHCPLIPASILQ
ncbi:MAG TPA: hypothetical protein VLI91_10645 [Roseiarcus sp.]|nr:hypothetical protein [Roseiarcus sp.]